MKLRFKIPCSRRGRNGIGLSENNRTDYFVTYKIISSIEFCFLVGIFYICQESKLRSEWIFQKINLFSKLIPKK